jgi:hypothetical protein
MIPKSWVLLPTSVIAAFFSAGMQFLLAWFLWTNLPPVYPTVNGKGAKLRPYPGASTTQPDGSYDSGRGYFDSSPGCFDPECLSAPLPALEFPNYSYANDICRTEAIVQIICIGLFLFSVFNNLPGVFRNLSIILWSERFLSEDEEGVTKIHYWRESALSRESQYEFFEKETLKPQEEDSQIPNPDSQTPADHFLETHRPGSRTDVGKDRNLEKALQKDQVDHGMVEIAKHFFRGYRLLDDDGNLTFERSMLRKYHLALHDFGKPGIVKFVENLSVMFCCFKSAQSLSDNGQLKGIPRSFCEVTDARNFLCEVLKV